jgi:hypothetical protein
MRHPPCGRPSGNDVRGKLVFDVRDAVTQVKLALLEPLDLELVGPGGVLQSRDGGIEVAMLLLQSRQLLLQLPLFIFSHSYRRLIAGALQSIPFCDLSFKSPFLPQLSKAGIAALHH